MQILPRTLCLTIVFIKISRGAAPHLLSQKPRFSLYHNKVLHLLADKLCYLLAHSEGVETQAKT